MIIGSFPWFDGGAAYDDARRGTVGADVRMTDEPVVARLLFLSANASDRSPLAVDREYNRVKRGLQNLGAWPAWRVAVEHVPAAAWEQVPEQLLLHAASIVHFAGHGHPDGSLEFSAQEGRPQRIPAGRLAGLLESYAGQVRLVVLNACYSDAHRLEQRVMRTGRHIARQRRCAL